MTDPKTSGDEKGRRDYRRGMTSIAIVLGLLAASLGGFVLGRFTYREAEDVDGKPGPSTATSWSTTPLSTQLCTDGLSPLVGGSGTEIGLALPARLADHVPSTPPIGKFETTTGGPVHPVNFPPAMEGQPVREAFVRGFVEPAGGGPGGYSIWVWEFSTKREATRALSHAYRERVCEFGDAPFVVEDVPVVVSKTTNDGGNDSAFWLYQNRVIQVDYSVWGNSDRAMQELLAVAERVWEFNQQLRSSF
jgi:hypothetical protein